MTALDAALGRAARFLLAQQDEDGGWRDFHLYKGVSTSWTTAYVAVRLAAVADLDARIPAALEAAAGFLRRHREPDGGWGYNARCMADADSTAIALLFLADRSPAPALKDVAVLASFQNADGGFATYRHYSPAHAWSASNAELTPTALRALSLFLPDDHLILRRGRAWLQGPAADCAAALYWWTTPAYMRTEMARIGLRAASRPAAPAPVSGAFEAALQLEERALLGGRPRELQMEAKALIACQMADGSWPTTPILRVPGEAVRPGSTALHDVPAAVDQRRLFTTATALAALRAVRPR